MKRKFINLFFPYKEDCKKLLLTMKLIICIMLLSFLHVSASTNSGLSGFSTSKENLNKLEKLSLKIKGKVTTAEGEALPGATILIKGTTSGTVTDIDGNFVLELPVGDETLVISYVGYSPEEVQVSGKTEITVSLMPNLSKLDEVVVVGYGTQKKSVITGAIAKVGAEDLAQSRDLRIEQSLQGKTAGVVIVNNSGQPGDNMTIRIRGVGTNNNPDPLFIVDGLPLDKTQVDFLNNSDVESVEVLKDASSAAIYGTRGANGVILITTKQGKKGEKFKVSYDGSYGIQNPWRKQDMLNGQQYMQLMNEAGKNDGRVNPYFSDATMQYIDSMGWNTNWQDEMYYKNAPKVNHVFSLSGAGEKSTYASSLGYFSQDGIIAKGKSNYKRINYRLNITHEFGILTVGTTINYANIKKNGVDANNQFGNGINQALNMPPEIPVMYDDGTYAVPTDIPFKLGIQEITNPVALLSIVNKSDETNEGVGNLWAEIKIFKGLVFRSAYGARYSIQTTANYTPVYYIDASHQSTSPYDVLTKEDIRSMNWNFDNTLTYKKTFGKHDVTAMVGMTQLKNQSQNMWAQKSDFIFHDLEHGYFDNSVNDDYDKIQGWYKENTIQSFFGRLNYSYDEKYLLEGSARRDGSSRFGPDNRYAVFPAFSAGWVASREKFFPANNFLDFLKIRGSWGKNGSDNIPDFKYASLMSNGFMYFYGDDKTPHDGILPSFIPNPSLKWEASQQTDIGTDIAMFHNRLTVGFDYYKKITKDWLIQAPISDIAGNNAPWDNGGKVQNKGYELELGYKNNLSKDLVLNIGVTAATNKSKVLDIPNAQHVLQGGDGVHGQSNLLRAEEGSSLGYFWGYKTNGIIQNDAELAKYIGQQPNAKVGDFIFVDVNGDSTISELDRTNLGSPYPKFTGGLNLGLNWKWFDINAFLYTALGQKVYDANRRSDLKYTNFTTDAMDRWHGEGTSNNYPAMSITDANGNFKKVSDFYVKDGSFLRLRTLNFGITLPKKWTNFIKLSKVRVYYLGENLLTWTKYPGMEVEVGGTPLALPDNNGNGTNGIGIDHGNYPVSKVNTIGINVEF
jgi:TonB-dependent starch-binding outer membrane protein SusC